MKKILIIGGVAGGASAATRLRRLDETLEIIMFEKGEYISFANCGLPYYIGDVIQNRDSLILQTPEKIKDRFNIDVRNNSEVIAVDSINKKITVKKLNGEIYLESFDYLILAPGAKPILPSIEGISNDKIFTLRNIKDMDMIKSFLKNREIKNSVVIGGGYVGVETAENLRHLGLETTLIEAGDNILSSFDSEISTYLEYELISNNVNLLLREKVIKFEDDGNIVKIYLESGKIIESEIVILSIGVTPDTKFLRKSGISLGKKGHIIVDEYLRTNFKNIYALGDAVLVNNLITNTQSFIPLAGPANRQGRIVANNIFGEKEKYRGSLGTAILKIFNLIAASTGINEKFLKNSNISFEKIYLHPNNHASYYPGSLPLSIKVIFNKENKEILGAQCFGKEGVDKFIDIISTILHFRGTINNLKELELAYAPPFLSAKSPANMAGFIADNILNNKSKQLFVEDLKNFDSSKHFILDVRESIELVVGSFKNSRNIPLSELRSRVNEIPKDKEIWIYCAIGLRGYIAERFLIQNNYNVKNIAGGCKNYLIDLNNKKQSSPIKEVPQTKENFDLNDYTDLCGLSCPGPLVKVKENMDKLLDGEIFKAKASDPGFYNDIQAWSKTTNNKILSLKKDGSNTFVVILKDKKSNSPKENKVIETNDGLTIVVFSGDLDKAIAAFIIANGALAMGKKVTMFFTFWGLSILKKRNINNDKNFIEKMFSFMLPKNSKGLPTSKMNMFGIGPKMIRWVMNKKNIMSLEVLINKSIKNGANLVACTMSMDVMGIKKNELIENIPFGGVGQYLGEADKANKNLFIG
ncbi:pyridine nucleotide-disulfide oxidoreductase [Fusobacterium ulcerans]|uniref:FAD-dependent oxidoreductase n=1 Tax=Fusobacterium ulcerans TaxID=861 RepID=UPI000E51230C|nr:FAD-dependent oxidoreductase [Fusobacterium ulcerans]RGY59488.1 pyridine nucleotide-disulfide oxidoreductase [Fusobacterium ulcerans]